MSFLTNNFLILASGASPSVFDYFSQSDAAGQGVCLLLLGISFIAWTLIIGKYLELKRLRSTNRVFEGHLRAASSLEQLEAVIQKAQPSPYSQLFVESLQSSYQIDSYMKDPSDVSKRMSYIESSMERSIAVQVERYESKLVVLGSIVSGTPFIGLLGTVWGVMDAFGAVAMLNTVTLATLAPGVSGALLTTIAGLMVAIPSLFCYNYLLTQTKVMSRELENFASYLADRLELELDASLTTTNN